jgi:CubicO group peptidase (beta-lactamase class C family)
MNRSATCALIVIASLGPAIAPAQPLPVAAPEDLGLSSERLARIGKFLNERIEKGNLPGAVVLVARKGRVAYFETFGFVDKPSGKRMPKDAVFRLGSMTKPWVSVAAMMLLEQGRIQLIDPVSKWFPAFKTMQVIAPKDDPGSAESRMVPAEREITVYDLLRHTSGLTYAIWEPNPAVKEAYARAGFGAGSDWRDLTRAEVIERLSKVPLVHQPGTVYNYGLSVDVLGFIVEAASGARLADFLQERLFGPLRMIDSGFRVPDEKLGRLAKALLSDPGTGKPNKLLDVSAAKKTDSGGIGGVSTAGDYARFAQMLLQGGELDGTRILSRASVKLMTSDQLGTSIPLRTSGGGPPTLALGSPSYTFGLGFAVRKAPGPANVLGSVGEFVWGGAGGTLFWADPQEQLVGVFMAQASWSDFGYYRRVVKELVDAAIAD